MARIAAAAALVALQGCLIPPLDSATGERRPDTGDGSSGDGGPTDTGGEGPSDTGADEETGGGRSDTGDEGADTGPGGGGDGGDVGEEADGETGGEFSAVATILGNHCLGCHGEGSDNGLAFPGTTGSPPTDLEIWETIVDKQASSADGPYVEPGEPLQSVIYKRLSKPKGESGRMPQNGWKEENFEVVDTSGGAGQAGLRATEKIRNWINDGAPKR